MKGIRRELLVYVGILIVMSALMHQGAWLTHPVEHMERLPQSSFGAFHPLLFALGVYLVFGLARLLFRLLKKLLTPKR